MHVLDEYGRFGLAMVSGVLMLGLLYGFFISEDGALRTEITSWFRTFL